MPFSARKVVTYFLVIIPIVVVAGFFIYKNYFKHPLLHPKQSSVVESVYGLGTVVAVREYDVKPGVNQTIKEYFVVEGQQVKKNESLIQFVGSQVIRAPFEGVVTAIPFKNGENVFPQVTVLELMDLSKLFIEVSLEQQMIVRVRPGQKDIVSFDNLREQPIEAKVDSLFPRSSQFVVKVVPTHLPQGVLPAMTADIAIEIETRANATLIPLAAIKNNHIIRIRNGKKESLPVEVGVVMEDWVELKSPSLELTDLLQGN
jgi:multidrug efflux pump subunit AcrA (membrane-fusion protein)